MSDISDDKNLWKTVEKLTPLPVPWGMTSSWMLIADLTRRHPGKLARFECPYPSGGTVWHFHERKPRLPWPQSHQTVLIRMVQWGHIHLHHEHAGGDMACPVVGGMKSERQAMIRPIFPLFAPRLRGLVEAVEECLGLGRVTRTPATTSETIGPRVIASALALFLHTSNPLEVEGALFDGVDARKDLLVGLSPLATLASTIEEPESEWEDSVMPDATRDALCPLFFLHDLSGNRTPGKNFTRIAIDVVESIAYLTEPTIDLLALYREYDRDISQTAFALVTHARQEHRSSR